MARGTLGQIPRGSFLNFFEILIFDLIMPFSGGFFALKSLHFRPSLLVTVFGLGSWFFSWGTLGQIPHKDFQFIFGNFEFWPTYAKFSIFLLIFFLRPVANNFRSRVLNFYIWFLWPITQRFFLNIFWNWSFDLLRAKFSLFNFSPKKFHFMVI